MYVFERLTRVVFAVLSFGLLLLTIGLIAYAVYQLFDVFRSEAAIGRTLLDAVGYLVIAVAVFEVAKYLFEEEVMNPTEMRHAGEARRSMTKFVSTIAIAVFLEALVIVFQTGRDALAVQNMLYPTLLLLAGVALIVGLGAYQRLSALTEVTVKSSPEVAAEEKAELDKRRQGAEA